MKNKKTIIGNSINKSKKIYRIGKTASAIGIGISGALMISPFLTILAALILGNIGVSYKNKGNEIMDNAYELVQDAETLRLTNEFNIKKDEFEILKEKAASNEISAIEYIIATQEFENIEKEYQSSLKELESTAYLDTIIETMSQDEEAVILANQAMKEFEKTQAYTDTSGKIFAYSFLNLITATIPGFACNRLCIDKFKDCKYNLDYLECAEL